MKKILSSLAIVGLAASAQAQIVYDFNDSVNATNSSWSTGFQTTTVSNLFSTADGLGVGGTGAVGSNSGNQVWSTTANSFAGDFASLTMSIAFEWNATPTNNGDFTIGFSTDNPGTYGGSGIPDNSLAGGFQLNSGSNGIELEHQYRDGSSGGSINTSSDRTLTVGNWYQIELNLTYDSTNGYDGDITVFNFNGTTGVRGSAIGSTMDYGVGSVPTGLTTTLSSDSSVWAFIGGRLISGQPLYFDNFTVDVTPVPEPSSAALLGLAGIGLALLRRRRSA